MPLDSSHFPLVWISYEHGPGHSHDEDFEALEANLKHGAPFVLLTDSVMTEEDEHSQEEKKRTSLWMKKHKAELRSLVLAMIVIEPSAAKRLAFKAFGVAFATFWGFPMKLALSREEATEIAEKLLSERWDPRAPTHG
jgi:hypothetical protein